MYCAPAPLADAALCAAAAASDTKDFVGMEPPVFIKDISTHNLPQLDLTPADSYIYDLTRGVECPTPP